MSSETIFLCNAIAYTLVAVFFYKKNQLSLGFFIWCYYTLSAWASFLFIQQPMYSFSIHACNHTLFPCIYLFVLFFICIYPLTNVKKIVNVVIPNTKTFRIFICILIICQIIFCLVDISAVTNIFTTSNELGDLRRNAYGRDGNEVNSFVQRIAILNRLSLLYSGIRPLAIGLSIVFYLNKNKNVLFKTFIITTLIESTRVIIVTVGRGQLLNSLIIGGLTLFLLRNELSQIVKKRIVLLLIPIVVVSIVFFVKVSVSRFGDEAMFYFYKYAGESMNNFNGLLFDKIRGNTEGRATFSLIYRYLFGYDDIVDTESRYAFIEKVSGVTPYIFYTFIGVLIIEFGKIIPIIFAILFNRLGMYFSKKGNEVYLDTMMVYVFFIYFFCYGLFTFPITGYDMLILPYLFFIHILVKKRKKIK